MRATLAEILKNIDITEESKTNKKLEFCQIMLSDEQLENLSSIKVGYSIARQLFIENILKETDPDLYEKVICSDRVPIFNMLESAKEFISRTND